MKYRFYFNFPRVNEKNKDTFVIHGSTCSCRHDKTNHNGFWTEWFDSYEDSVSVLNKLIPKFREHEYEIRLCKRFKT